MQTGGRVMVMPHLTAHMWLMIKLDKWFAVLNCPLMVWCLLECDTLPGAPFREGPHHSIFSLCLCTSGLINIITVQLISVEVTFLRFKNRDAYMHTLCSTDTVDMDTSGPGRWPPTSRSAPRFLPSSNRQLFLATAAKCLLFAWGMFVWSLKLKECFLNLI